MGGVLDGQYRLVELLGRGGMGEVWRAHDESLGRDVAVKLIAPELVGGDGAAVARFRREARVCAALHHRHIVVVHALGEAVRDGVRVPYLVMELLRGRSLADLLRSAGPLPLPDVARWAGHACAALSAAHDRVVHRDLKPANLWLQQDGDLKVLDFGIAGFLRTAGTERHTRLTRTGQVPGTPAYMAPEYARTVAPDPRSDLYALGCVLYEMVTGRRPFEAADAWGFVAAHFTEQPVPPGRRRPGLPSAWDALILALLEKDPAARPQTAAEVRALLPEQDGPRADGPAADPRAVPAGGRRTPPTAALPAGRDTTAHPGASAGPATSPHSATSPRPGPAAGPRATTWPATGPAPGAEALHAARRRFAAAAHRLLTAHHGRPRTAWERPLTEAAVHHARRRVVPAAHRLPAARTAGATPAAGTARPPARPTAPDTPRPADPVAARPTAPRRALTRRRLLLGTAGVAITGGAGLAVAAGELRKTSADHEVWRYAAGTARDVARPPVVSERAAHAVSDDGTVHAVDFRTGERRWRTEIWSEPVPLPGMVAGLLVCTGGGMDEKQMTALDPDSGEVAWRLSGVHAEPAAYSEAHGLVWVARDHHVEAVEAASGRRRWRRRIPGDGWVYSPAFREDVVLAVGDSDAASSVLVALDPEEGDELWRVPCPLPTFRAERDTVAAGDALVCALGDVTCLDRRTGRTRWTRSEFLTSAPPVTDETVCWRDGAAVRGVDLATGKNRWRVARGEGARRIAGTGAAAGEVFVFATVQGVAVLDARTGTLRRAHDTGHEVHSAAGVTLREADGGPTAYVHSHHGGGFLRKPTTRLHAVDPATGTGLWSSEVPGESQTDPLHLPEGAVLVRNEVGTLFALRPR
ncbi:PQQ-binding-like beta-propeller repeat protein [Streptomyces sp. JJ36]|uniref:protein kinase domain-containing protein n=1 Tax=Streptomyces sp. JJ36 TaxID=2736645 RepID=UPI001F2FC0C2|nr:PQQ-binding-like beta-propeller repeat protein [Streptomyces sp. JJ36]MCF6524071.1 PQQ-binding-like beta-propeller repeat protein [Streptomyces sp. JJ36]